MPPMATTGNPMRPMMPPQAPMQVPMATTGNPMIPPQQGAPFMGKGNLSPQPMNNVGAVVNALRGVR